MNRYARITKRDRPQRERGDVADVGDERRRRGHTPVVREVDRQHGEGDPHHELADELGRLVQPEAAAVPDLQVVVEEPDRPHPDHQEQQQQPGGGETPAGLVGQEQVRGEVPADGRADDHRAAHGGRALLGQVALGSVVPDLLAEALPAERADRQGREQDGDDQAEASRDQDRPHAPAPVGQEVGGEQLQAVGAAGLHEDDVPGTQHLRQQLAGSGPVRHVHRLLSSRSPGCGRAIGYAYRIGSHGDDQVDAGGRRVPSEPLVLGRGAGAQLGHGAEDGDPPLPRQSGERGQRGAHRLGVGVVGVVDDGDAVGAADDLHAPAAAGSGRRQRRGDVAGRHPGRERGAGRRQRVGDLVRTHDLEGDRVLLPRRDQREPRPGRPRPGTRRRPGRRPSARCPS